MTHMRAWAVESQELLLAELHDELGASLHAIRMFAEIGRDTEGEDTVAIVEKVHHHASEAANSVRRVTHLLDEGVSGEDFIKELRQPDKWLPARCDFTLDLQVPPGILAAVSPIALGHLLHFYHECLANINRHARDVSTVAVSFSAEGRKLALSVEDDGSGLLEPNKVPRSLARRAKLARGRITTTRGQGDRGTCVRIEIDHAC